MHEAEEDKRRQQAGLGTRPLPDVACGGAKDGEATTAGGGAATAGGKSTTGGGGAAMATVGVACAALPSAVEAAFVPRDGLRRTAQSQSVPQGSRPRRWSVAFIIGARICGHRPVTCDSQRAGT